MRPPAECIPTSWCLKADMKPVTQAKEEKRGRWRQVRQPVKRIGRQACPIAPAPPAASSPGASCRRACPSPSAGSPTRGRASASRRASCGRAGRRRPWARTP
eukprot:121294-Pleurochrysis_carterae.AAC.1